MPSKSGRTTVFALFNLNRGEEVLDSTDGLAQGRLCGAAEQDVVRKCKGREGLRCEC